MGKERARRGTSTVPNMSRHRVQGWGKESGVCHGKVCGWYLQLSQHV